MKNIQLLTKTYTTLCPVVINYLYNKTGDYETAQDLAQDVFLRLMEYENILCEDTVKSMVFTISRNLLYDYLRRHYKKQEITTYYYEYAVTSTNETEECVMANDLLRIEKSRILQLPAQRRKVYVMSRFQEKSATEISEELCLSRRTIENHLRISRIEVREYIQQCI